MNKIKRFFKWLWNSLPGPDIPPPLTQPETPKPRAESDIIGRQKGQNRNRVHIYRRPYGYPIRLCDWVAVNPDSIEYKGTVQGIAGPAEPLALEAALDWRANAGDRICRHCLAVTRGKRESIGQINHGHGTGAP